MTYNLTFAFEMKNARGTIVMKNETKCSIISQTLFKSTSGFLIEIKYDDYLSLSAVVKSFNVNVKSNIQIIC